MYVARSLKFQIFSQVTLCPFIRMYRRPERSYGLRLQGHTVKISPNDTGSHLRGTESSIAPYWLTQIPHFHWLTP